MRRTWLIVLAGVLLVAYPAGGRAASCSKDEFAQAVDRTGAALRRLNAENTPRLQAKMRKLKESRGWPEVGYEAKAFEALYDERIAAFDAQANDLLAKVDALGTSEPANEGDCAKLEELTAASLELQATVKAKAAYSLSKLDQMLAGPVAVPQPEGASKEAKAEPKPDAKSEARKQSPPDVKGDAKTKGGEPRRTVATAPSPKATPKTGEIGDWTARTEPGHARNEVSVIEPSPLPQTIPPLTREEEGYTIEEIMAASEGVFGKVSASLGSVIEHLFANSGRPTGYILGSEGGGAFLAGVRYGDGTLYLRSGSSQKIYWHGPSLGTDIGAAGSKTLFLIYGLADPEQLYSNFTGIDGSAYVVGGAGATLFSNGSVILAPVRSGLGLRLGANIGYIRFTPKQTWNPF